VTTVTALAVPQPYVDDDIHQFSFTGPTGPVFFLPVFPINGRLPSRQCLRVWIMLFRA
jgi:hypothetical protein